ncbi:MAG: ankyrin repeat domain-containing protein [Victivallaceae bacterium]|nr:ankyrin repeat domain-containing protein [Victivallaceae bacterium]
MSKPVYKWLLIGGGIAVTVFLLLYAAFTAYSGALLKLAIGEESVTATKLLLALGADPNPPTGSYLNFYLGRLSRYDHFEISMLLLEHGANVSSDEKTIIAQLALYDPSGGRLKRLLDAGVKPEDAGLTMLAIHSYMANIPKMQAALDAGADPNFVPPAGLKYHLSPLRMAISSQNAESVRLLLAAGATPEFSGLKTFTPLQAAMVSCPDVIDDLLAAGAKPIAKDASLAIMYKRNDILKSLIAAGVDIGKTPDGKTPPLFTAASLGTPETIDMLLAAGADINETSTCPPLATSDYGQKDCTDHPVTVLEYADSNPDCARQLAARGAGAEDLRRAISKGDIERLKKLLSWGVDPNLKVDQTRSAAELACELNRCECLLALLCAGAHIPEFKTMNNTTFCVAAWSGNTAKVESALKAGLNPDGCNGIFPLSFAAAGDNPAAIPLLVAAGADANKTDTRGKPPLWTAMENNKMGAAAALVKAGANVNAKDASGDTPLCRASREGLTEWVKFLIAAGADVNAPGKYDCLPLYFADKPEIMEMLQAAGARKD